MPGSKGVDAWKQSGNQCGLVRCLLMDCFNHSCPFRVNETSNANRCECVACQNRSNSDFIITSNRTLTNDELAMLNALRSGDKNYGVGNWC